MKIHFDGTLSDWLSLILVCLTMVYCFRIKYGHRYKLTHDERLDINSGLSLLLDHIDEKNFELGTGLTEIDIQVWRDDVQQLKDKMRV